MLIHSCAPFLSLLLCLHLVDISVGSHSCVHNYNSSTDYFPDKATLSYAEYFNVTYFNSYKIIDVDSGYEQQRIVAYQCGTPQPDIANASIYVSIPVSRVAVTHTTQIPYIELLGMRQTIKAIGTNNSLVASACLLDMMASGAAIDASNLTELAVKLEAARVNVTFGDASAYNGVMFAEWAEKTSEGVAEWLDYVALFYNLEAEASDILDEILDRLECNKANAALYPYDDKPVVLYSNYYWSYDAWATGSCPNYYCDLIENAGGKTLATGTWLTYDSWLKAAKNATIIWHVGDFELLYDKFSSDSDFTSLPAVVNQQVYDTTGNGKHEWFENRFAEPDLVFEDVLNMIHPCVNPDHDRVFLRNAFTESKGIAKTADDCTGSWSDAIEINADDCTSLSATEVSLACLSDDSSDDSVDQGSSATSSIVHNSLILGTLLLFLANIY